MLKKPAFDKKCFSIYDWAPTSLSQSIPYIAWYSFSMLITTTSDFQQNTSLLSFKKRIKNPHLEKVVSAHTT